MQIEIANRQNELPVRRGAIRKALQRLLGEEKMDADLSVAVVANEEMRNLNKRFLNREGSTDVLSFPYERDPDRISGEIVVNASEALRQVAFRQNSAEDELLLYVVHGLLHLLGYDDNDPQKRRAMRERERHILERCGRAVEF